MPAVKPGSGVILAACTRSTCIVDVGAGPRLSAATGETIADGSCRWWRTVLWSGGLWPLRAPRPVEHRGRHVGGRWTGDDSPIRHARPTGGPAMTGSA